MRQRLVGPGSLVVSLLVHAALFGFGAALVASVLGQSGGARERAIEVEVEVALAPSALDLSPRAGETSPAPTVPPPGGDRPARPDLTRAGRGGDGRAEPALNLASSSDGLTLSRDVLNGLRRNQQQRTLSSRERRSPHDRRALPAPAELWLASDGALPRKPELRGSGLPDSLRGRLGGEEHPEHRPAARAALIPGGAFESREGARGAPVAPGGAVLAARPSAVRGRSSTPALVRGKTADDMDSDQEVATRVAALLQASSAGGLLGEGAGGEPARAAPGSGGTLGAGARSSPNGSGQGPGPDLARDPRLQAYFGALSARLQRVLAGAFPEWAIREGRGGLVVFDMTLLGNGRIAAVRLVRPSGIAEYDRRVLERVQGVGAFAPLPAQLGSQAVVRYGWDSLNPAVGRDGPGPGGRVH